VLLTPLKSPQKSRQFTPRPESRYWQLAALDRFVACTAKQYVDHRIRQREHDAMDSERLEAYLKVACIGLGFDIGEAWWTTQHGEEEEDSTTTTTDEADHDELDIAVPIVPSHSTKKSNHEKKSNTMKMEYVQLYTSKRYSSQRSRLIPPASNDNDNNDRNQQQHILSPRLIHAIHHSNGKAEVVWANCPADEHHNVCGLLGDQEGGVCLQTAVGMPIVMDRPATSAQSSSSLSTTTSNLKGTKEKKRVGGGAGTRMCVVVMFSPHLVKANEDAMEYLKFIRKSATSTSIPCLLPVLSASNGNSNSNRNSKSKKNATEDVIITSTTTTTTRRTLLHSNSHTASSSASSCTYSNNANSNACTSSLEDQHHQQQQQHRHQFQLQQEIKDLGKRGVVASMLNFRRDRSNSFDSVTGSVAPNFSASQHDITMEPKDCFGIPMLPCSNDDDDDEDDEDDIGMDHHHHHHSSSNDDAAGNYKSSHRRRRRGGDHPEDEDEDGDQVIDELSYGVWSVIHGTNHSNAAATISTTSNIHNHKATTSISTSEETSTFTSSGSGSSSNAGLGLLVQAFQVDPAATTDDKGGDPIQSLPLPQHQNLHNHHHHNHHQLDEAEADLHDIQMHTATLDHHHDHAMQQQHQQHGIVAPHNAAINSYNDVNEISIQIIREKMDKLEEFVQAFLGISVFDIADVWMPNNRHITNTTSNNTTKSTLSSLNAHAHSTIDSTAKQKSLSSTSNSNNSGEEDEEEDVHLQHVSSHMKDPDNANLQAFSTLSTRATIKYWSGAVGRAFASGNPVWSCNENMITDVLTDSNRAQAFDQACIKAALSVPVLGYMYYRDASSSQPQSQQPQSQQQSVTSCKRVSVCVLTFYSQKRVASNPKVLRFVQKAVRLVWDGAYRNLPTTTIPPPVTAPAVSGSTSVRKRVHDEMTTSQDDLPMNMSSRSNKRELELVENEQEEIGVPNPLAAAAGVQSSAAPVVCLPVNMAMSNEDAVAAMTMAAAVNTAATISIATAANTATTTSTSNDNHHQNNSNNNASSNSTSTSNTMEEQFPVAVSALTARILGGTSFPLQFGNTTNNTNTNNSSNVSVSSNTVVHPDGKKSATSSSINTIIIPDGVTSTTTPPPPQTKLASTLRICRIQGCDDLTHGRKPYCLKHSGNRNCEFLGCTKCAQGSTRFCIAHGGGRRCTFPGCDKGARDKFFCAAHGGGKRCSHPQCGKSAVGGSTLCTSHGGGRRCAKDGCSKSAQAATNFCVRHGGGKKCASAGCQKVARGRTAYCAAHGGGVRCKMDGCNRVAIGKKQLCRAHREAATNNVDAATKASGSSASVSASASATSTVAAAGDPADVDVSL